MGNCSAGGVGRDDGHVSKDTVERRRVVMEVGEWLVGYPVECWEFKVTPFSAYKFIQLSLEVY